MAQTHITKIRLSVGERLLQSLNIFDSAYNLFINIYFLFIVLLHKFFLLGDFHLKKAWVKLSPCSLFIFRNKKTETEKKTETINLSSEPRGGAFWGVDHANGDHGQISNFKNLKSDEVSVVV